MSSTTLVRHDDALAHERIQDAFRRFSDTIKAYAGVVHELRGDALVALFDRASDAVCAALGFQSDNAQFNARLGDEVLPQFRVGISMAEVIIADRTLTGTGVVLAQRLEQLAPPGGVCLQGAAYETLPQRLPFIYRSLGDQTFKGFDAPVRAYAVSLTPGKGAPAPQGRAARKGRWLAAAVVGVGIAVAGGLAWLQPWTAGDETRLAEPRVPSASDQPSIAVLPFTNMSGDPEQEYFSDGITEDIITDLSQISSLGVIARNSSFAYRNTPTTVTDLAEELGVEYVLEGSVRKVGDRVRITAQLVEATSGQSLWAERYDRRLADIFELQDEIRNKIVSALSIELIGEEAEHLFRRSTNSFEAYDLFLQGVRFYNELTLESLSQAEALYRKAIALDPEFARAYGALGITLGRRFQIDFTRAAPGILLDEAMDMIEKAVAIEPTSPQVQWALGYVHMWRQEFEQAAEAIDKAVTLSPNYADGWGLLSLINNQLGRGEQALRFIRKAKALNPRYTWEYPYNEGRAYYNLHEYEKAIKPLLAALERNENSLYPRLYLTASYARLDRSEDAHWEVARLEVMFPGLSLARLRSTFPIAAGEHGDRFFEDLRTAGLPN